MPLIRGLAKAGIPFRGSELWIFGSDGRYIVKSKRKRWRREFLKWTDKGLKIRYILLDVDEEVHEELRTLKEELKGNFDAVALNKGAVPEIAIELETRHPTLFLGREGQNAAWIEGLHRRDSVYAYDVDYISPKAMQRQAKEKARFRSYKAKLESVLDNSQSVWCM